MMRRPTLLLLALLLHWATPGSAQESATPQATPNAEVQILSPGHSETVFNNLGSVIVNLAVRELEEDEEIVLLLDAKEVARDTRPPAFVVLNELNRGAHQLQVRIVDGSGQTVAESPVSTFYVFRASRLFPNRAGDPV